MGGLGAILHGRWFAQGGGCLAVACRDRGVKVNWAPDSKGVVYQRLNRIQNHLDLGLADVHSGVARILLTEQDSYWVNINDDFRFLNKGKQFLWGSERDGFHHLYLYSMDEKRVTQLTKGEWEVAKRLPILRAMGKMLPRSR